MKAKLNTHLLSTLPRVLRMTNDEVAAASGISIAQWYRLVKHPEKLTIQQLLDLANGLQIPVSRFFSTGKADVVGMREDYVINSEYQKCYYDSDAVSKKVGKGTATSWREAAAAVGMHWTNVAASLLAVSRTPVSRLLVLCDTFNFNLFEFLIDPNKDVKSTKHKGGSDAALRADIAALNGRIDSLNATVSDMTEKYAALLERHNKLLERFNNLERSFRDYTGGQMLMAAEPDGD